VQSTVSNINSDGLAIDGYEVLYTVESRKTNDGGEANVNAASAGGGSSGTFVVVIIAAIILIIGVGAYAAWPYRDKIMYQLGLRESEDPEDPKAKAAKKAGYSKSQKIEVQPQTHSILDAIDRDLDAMQMAVDMKCDINERSKDNQSTAAILTVVQQKDADLLKLLAENNADLNAKNMLGLAACHYAARDGLDMHLQLLIDYKADLQITNLQGFTPLDIAKQNGRGEIVSMLQDHVVEIACEEDYSSPGYNDQPMEPESLTSEDDPLAFVSSMTEKRHPLPKVKRQLPPFTTQESLRKKELFPSRKRKERHIY